MDQFLDGAKTKKILVTGSKHWTARSIISRALIESGPGIVLYGDSEGADRIARDVVLGLMFVGPGWSLKSYVDGLTPNVVLAFPLHGSRGTWSRVDSARQVGASIRLYGVSEECECADCTGWRAC